MILKDNILIKGVSSGYGFFLRFFQSEFIVSKPYFYKYIISMKSVSNQTVHFNYFIFLNLMI